MNFFSDDYNCSRIRDFVLMLASKGCLGAMMGYLGLFQKSLICLFCFFFFFFFFFFRALTKSIKKND